MLLEQNEPHSLGTSGQETCWLQQLAHLPICLSFSGDSKKPRRTVFTTSDLTEFASSHQLSTISSRSQSCTYQHWPKYSNSVLLEIQGVKGKCRNNLNTLSSGDRFHLVLFQTLRFIPPLACFCFCFRSPLMTRFTALRKDDYRKLMQQFSGSSLSRTNTYQSISHGVTLPYCLCLQLGFPCFLHPDLCTFCTCFPKVGR